MVKEKTQDTTPDKSKPVCGIVMPISAIDTCTAEHWGEVLGILKDVITSIDFEANLVSDADDIGIIQKRIIQNLYNNDIVVCDVSAKNPNVMFELGMRLAFDKPTIIIKDDRTDYSFDTSVIEHLTYPRDLRFTKIIDFKDSLQKKIRATIHKAKQDPTYSTFLKNFGQYKVAHLQETEISSNEFLVNSLNDIKREIAKLSMSNIQIEKKSIGKETFNESFVSSFISQYLKHANLDSNSNLLEHLDDMVDWIWVSSSIIKDICKTKSELRKKLLDFILPF